MTKRRSKKQRKPAIHSLSMQIRTAHDATAAVKSLRHDTVQMNNEELDRSELYATRMSMNSQIRQSEQSITLGRLAFEVDGLSACIKVSSDSNFGSSTLFATTYSTL